MGRVIVRVFILGADTAVDVAAMVVVNGDSVPWGDLCWSASKGLFLSPDDDCGSNPVALPSSLPTEDALRGETGLICWSEEIEDARGGREGDAEERCDDTGKGDKGEEGEADFLRSTALASSRAAERLRKRSL